MEPKKMPNQNPINAEQSRPSRPNKEGKQAKEGKEGTDAAAPIAHTQGAKGEGSYEGTRQYDDDLEKFTKEHPVEESLSKAEKIDPNDPALKEAEGKGKAKARTYGEDEGRPSSPSQPS